jgi:acylglycerol lipase
MTQHLAYTYDEDRLRHPDGLRIHYRTWHPTTKPRGALVICHGFNAHGGHYVWAAEQFAAAGIAVYALDLRGRGRSEGRRFYVRYFDQYVADIAAVIDVARARHPALPLYLLGHSMGGVVATTYALNNQRKLAGLICESFAFRVPAPRAALLAMKVLSHLMPRLPMLRLKTAYFTRDPATVKRLDADPLIAGETQPVATIAALVGATERLEAEFHRLTLPVFILHGTADRATLPAGSEQFARDAGSTDKTLKLYQGHYHDLLADIGKEEVLQDMLDWIETRIAH